jgi:ribosomal protein L11 methyltransferase
MPWLQLKLLTPAEKAQQITDAMETCGAISVSIEDSGDEALLEAGQPETPLYWSRNRIAGLFPEHTDIASVLAHIRHEFDDEILSYETDLLTDQDWGTAWRSHYKPMCVGHNLWVCPSWCAPPEPQATNVILDPGLAFGTGDHPTTALCLEWLSQQDLKGKTLIDYGCGSGILSIAALKLGARRALGIDIDPQAVDVSRHNAASNGVAERFQASDPDATPNHYAADVVVANILLEPLTRLASQITGLVRPHGQLAISGLLKSQVDEVSRYYDTYFDLEIRTRGEWLMLAGNKISPKY